MSDAYRELDTLIGALRNALEQNNWEAVAKLDASTVSLVSDRVKLLEKGGDQAGFRERLTELQSLYDEIAVANQSNRNELSAELKKLHKEHKAISQYLKSSGY